MRYRPFAAIIFDVSTTVEAVYENGKLVLSHPLPLAEKSHVRVTIETQADAISDEERTTWLALSEQTLLKTWDDSEDDIFNELLQK